MSFIIFSAQAKLIRQYLQAAVNDQPLHDTNDIRSATHVKLHCSHAILRFNTITTRIIRYTLPTKAIGATSLSLPLYVMVTNPVYAYYLYLLLKSPNPSETKVS